MEGKTVLVISAGNDGRLTTWDSLKTFGIRIILLYTEENNHGIHKVDTFYQYDYADHFQDKQHTENILKLLASERIDGCFTCDSSCVPLTAMICNKMKLPGGNVDAAILNTNKYEYLKVLSSNAVTKPYSSDVIEILNVKDIEGVPEDFPFPAVLKPVYVSGSGFVKRVENKKEAIREFIRMKKEYYSEENYQYSTMGFTDAMMLMEFLEGPRQEVDTVVSHGVQILCVITDYTSAVTDRFLYSCYRLPSQLPNDQKLALETATDEIRKAIGISDGSLNFEFRYAKNGPKLIEVNGRMGMLHRKENVKKCYDVDVLRCTVQACLGITTMPISLTPQTHVIAVICYESLHGDQLKSAHGQQYLKELESKGNFRIIPHSRFNELYEQPVCCLCFYDNDGENAKSWLLKMFEECGLDSPSYNIRGLLNEL